MKQYLSTLHDIFSETYVEEYAKLRAQYPWWSVQQVMRAAKHTTLEYLYLCAKEKLPKQTLVWPKEWG